MAWRSRRYSARIRAQFFNCPVNPDKQRMIMKRKAILGLMLTTEALISELQNGDKPKAMAGGMDGGMGF